jgi:hypothetical protein
MKKNLLESEIKRFQELSNYDANNNSVLSENKIDFYDNENERILEMHHRAINKEFLTEDEDDPVVRKKFDFGAKVKGQKYPRWWGKHGGGAEARLTLDYKKYREIDKELNTGADLLAKMNEDIGGNKDWAMIPPNVKSALANGFNEFLQVASKSEHIKKLSRQKRRDLRKIFKKAQRWKFKIVDLKNNLSQPEEGKKKASKIKPELTVTFPQGEGAPTEEQIIAEIRESLNDINMANCEGPTIGAPSCSALVGQNVTVTEDDGTSYTLVQPVSREVSKGALETAVVYEMITPASYKRGEGGTYFLQDTKQIVIPNEDSGFAPGSDVVDTTYVDKTVQTIYDQLMNTTFELTDEKTKKVIVTKTGRDIVDDINAGLTKSAIVFEYMDTTSSASNIWSGKKALDFTHKNDGTKVKNLNDLPTTGEDKSNTNLAIRRNKNLTAAVLAALDKLPGIKRYGDFKLSQELRVTDTGGKTDDTRDKSKYPNIGQYGGFKVGFMAYVEEAVVKKEKTGVKGKIGQSLIKLVWVGAPDTGVEFNFDIDFDWWPGTTNRIVHKNIFTGQLQAGGAWWSKNLRGYNKVF